MENIKRKFPFIYKVIWETWWNFDPTFSNHLKHDTKNSEIISLTIHHEIMGVLTIFLISKITWEKSDYFAANVFLILKLIFYACVTLASIVKNQTFESYFSINSLFRER